MNAVRIAPPLAVAVWLTVIAIGLVIATQAAGEPPVWDAMTYAQKAMNFWQAVDVGKSFNAFALPLTVRPPGTVLMSYPFGWSENYHWFYFRSSAIPMGLFIAAVYIAGWSRSLSRAGHWMLAALAIALAGIPILFQFQQNDDLKAFYNWGLVDAFLAGLAALAAAAAVRSVASRSIGWAVVAALAGAFCFWVKPSGLLAMGLTGAVWLILVGFAWRQLNTDRRFIFISFASALAIFATAAIVLGFIVAARLRASAHLAAAALCLLAGCWFWLYQTEISHIRYFLPFGVITLVLLTPPLVRSASSLVLPALLAAPAIVTAVALLTPQPSAALQTALGINLHVDDYRAENDQATALLRQLKAEGIWPSHHLPHRYNTRAAQSRSGL